MEKISLSLNLVNQVMSYLGSRPYQEVFQLINAMQDEAKQSVASKIEQPVEPTES
jgi:hypothetical protein